MMGIFNLLKTNNIEVLKFSLEGLIEVVRLNYVYMGRYLEQILGSTYYLFNLY
jgi:NADH:ubiquinone oxidoreductase subunit K